MDIQFISIVEYRVAVLPRKANVPHKMSHFETNPMACVLLRAAVILYI